MHATLAKASSACCFTTWISHAFCLSGAFVTFDLWYLTLLGALSYEHDLARF